MGQRAGNHRQRLDEDRGQERREEKQGIGAKGSSEGDLKRYLPRGTKDCLWVERRDTWPIGKWQYINVKLSSVLG